MPRKNTIFSLIAVFFLSGSLLTLSYFIQRQTDLTLKAAPISVNPNGPFKYLGIYHVDYYSGSWSKPTRFNDNFNLYDSGFHNILLPVFSPGPDDAYFSEARSRGVKTIVYTTPLTGGQDATTWGTPQWEIQNKDKLDLYARNQDVIYAFYTDEPSNNLGQANYRSGYINLTKRLRELYPGVGIMAVEFRPFITEKYDSEMHQYATDIGFDAYGAIWGRIRGWLNQMKTQVPSDKRLWLVPQAFLNRPNQGPFTSAPALNRLLGEYINFAKNDDRITGILLYNYTVDAINANTYSSAGLKELTDENNLKFNSNTRSLILQTVLELKSNQSLEDLKVSSIPQRQPAGELENIPPTTAIPTFPPTPVSSCDPKTISGTPLKGCITTKVCDTNKTRILIEGWACNPSQPTNQYYGIRNWAVGGGSNIWLGSVPMILNNPQSSSHCGGNSKHGFKLEVEASDVGRTTFPDTVYLRSIPAGFTGAGEITGTGTVTCK